MDHPIWGSLALTLSDVKHGDIGLHNRPHANFTYEETCMIKTRFPDLTFLQTGTVLRSIQHGHTPLHSIHLRGLHQSLAILAEVDTQLSIDPRPYSFQHDGYNALFSSITHLDVVKGFNLLVWGMKTHLNTPSPHNYMWNDYNISTDSGLYFTDYFCDELTRKMSKGPFFRPPTCNYIPTLVNRILAVHTDRYDLNPAMKLHLEGIISTARRHISSRHSNTIDIANHHPNVVELWGEKLFRPLWR